MNASIITCSNVLFEYRADKRVLEDVSFEVARGEFLTVIGCNGAGKSTLLKLIARREFSNDGDILISGKNVREFREKEFATVVGYLEQFPQLSSLSIEEYVLMGALPRFGGNRFWFTKSEKKQMTALLEETGLSTLKNCSVAEVSGGERQVAQICRALMAEPKLLLLDEPVSHLDINHAEMVIGLLRKVKKERDVTVVTTLHDLNLAYACSDRILLLDGTGSCIELANNVTKDIDVLKSAFQTDFETLKSGKCERGILVPAWDFK